MSTKSKLSVSRHIRFVACLALAIILGIPARHALAQMEFRPAQEETSLLGPMQAKGAVIWSHGRSIEIEDSTAATPDYIRAFRKAGWDTFRLDRLRIVDTLPVSGAVLAGEAEALKQMGYARVVLAGQSFGAFISLIAADLSSAVDAVIATAPAAFGSSESNPAFYGLNATRMYDLLGNVRRARVALFFFEGDIFDPGGRGPMAEQILAAHHLPHLIIDRPAHLETHWAAADSAFTYRFASCLADFAAADAASGTFSCRSMSRGLQIAAVQ